MKKSINGHFLIAVEPGWKKQVHQMILSRIKRNGAKELASIQTKSEKVVMKMTMTTLL
uniref:Uncharacterized protein n=1 Tax=Peronospora matthiolae TaxID=2874970 RepID=A0AAV1T1N1_9STRA